MRNRLVVLAVAAALMGLAAAPAAAESITITLTSRMVEGGVNHNFYTWLKNWAVPNFESYMRSQGKDVKVQLVQFGGSDEALKQQYALDLKVGRGHDLMGFDGFWVPEFVAAGLLKPLDEVAGPEVNQWEGWQHISPGLQALLSYQGKRYGIPLGTDVRVIFYRRDLFRKAGIPQWWAWQPRSWEDILATARQIKRALPDVIPLQINAGTSMGEATTMQGYFMVLLGAGGHIYDFDTGKWIVRSPAILDALEFYKRIYRDEQLGDARMQLLSDARSRSFALFRDGKIAMLVEGDWFWRSVLAPGSEWALPERDSLVGWAAMPAKEPGKGYRGQDFVTISGGTGVVLNPNSRHPKEAWAFLAFANSREALEAFQKIEPRIRVRDDVPVPGDPFLTVTSSALLPLTTARPLEPAYAEVSFQAQLMTERVVSGQMTPQQAMEAYARAVTDLVGRDKVTEQR